MSNNLDNQRPLYSELTNEETTALNGGRYCRYVCFRQWVCNWYRCYFRQVCAYRCY